MCGQLLCVNRMSTARVVCRGGEGRVKDTTSIPGSAPERIGRMIATRTERFAAIG